MHTYIHIAIITIIIIITSCVHLHFAPHLLSISSVSRESIYFANVFIVTGL